MKNSSKIMAMVLAGLVVLGLLGSAFAGAPNRYPPDPQSGLIGRR